MLAKFITLATLQPLELFSLATGVSLVSVMS